MIALPNKDTMFPNAYQVVCQQLLAHKSDSNLFEPLLSAVRACHSTETVLIKMVNDILLHMNSDSTLVLLLLDNGAAFDTIDTNSQ